MIPRWIKAAIDRVSAHLPPPMAAPETSTQRWRRFRLIGLLMALAIVTLIAPTLVQISQLGAATLWAGLAFGCLVQGTTWLIAKLHADAEWLADRTEKAREP